MTETDTSGAPMNGDDIRSYTVLTARLLDIDLDEAEVDLVTAQVARVAVLVDQMDRIDDEGISAAPRFVAGSSPANLL